MSKYIVKNLDKINQVEVRIYRVSKEGLLTPISNFTALDELGLNVSVQLKSDPGIDCAGAIDFAGILTFDDVLTGTLSNSSGTTTFENNQEMVTGLEDLGFEVYELTKWIPEEPEIPVDPEAPTEGYPRARVMFTQPFDTTSPNLADVFEVELIRAGEVTKVFAGNISDVFDDCQKQGILLSVWDYQFLIGCEPGTPPTKVKITLGGGVEVNPNSLMEENDSFYNPLLVLTNTTIDVNIAWDGLPEFWCKLDADIVGATGTVGDVLSSRANTAMNPKFPPNLIALAINDDYTEYCSDAYSPELCRIGNQKQQYMGLANGLTYIYNGAFIEFNQNPHWVPEGTRETGICVAGNYTPITLMFEVGKSYFGYGIPEPERGM